MGRNVLAEGPNLVLTLFVPETRDLDFKQLMLLFFLYGRKESTLIRFFSLDLTSLLQVT